MGGGEASEWRGWLAGGTVLASMRSMVPERSSSIRQSMHLPRHTEENVREEVREAEEARRRRGEEWGMGPPGERIRRARTWWPLPCAAGSP